MFRASPKLMEKLEATTKTSSTLPPDQRAFLDAARTGDANKVRELLAKRVPVDVREDFCTHYMQNEQTALMYAAGDGHLEVVKTLLKARADVKAIDKMVSRESGGEKTALHYAAGQPNVAVVEALLNAGADPNALTKNAWNRGYTPLIYALQAGHRDVVQLLIKRGTNLGSQIERKQTMSPLCAALDADRDEVSTETIRDFALLLLEAKADPNGVGDANQTAIFSLARAKADEFDWSIANELLAKLLKAGAKPDWLNKFGSTALETALIRKNPEAIRLLLEAGADVNRVFKRGTALDIIEYDTKNCGKDKDSLQRCKEITAILKKSGAKRKAQLPDV